MFRACGLILFLLGVSVGHAAAQSKSLVEPPYAIWDVELGASVETIPTLDVNDLACGTNGGPTSSRPSAGASPPATSMSRSFSPVTRR